jgi:S-adenosylmethionine synthetase
MFEKVNPSHPDKVADRIAGAIVDLAYKKNQTAKMACEVLIGHDRCFVIMETSENIRYEEVKKIVKRIAGDISKIEVNVNKQDEHLAKNQEEKLKCGDNGIFKGIPTTAEQIYLSHWARRAYDFFPYDGKFIINGRKVIICQSNATEDKINDVFKMKNYDKTINPLGEWGGGLDVDTGATNRKLGSDMGDAVTGGGLHGKDLSKADVSVNIYAHLKAQKIGKPVELFCAIGDEEIDGKPYEEIVNIAKEYVEKKGGFEKLAEWGLI